MSEKTQPAYQRILLKLSGESLQGNTTFGIDPNVLCNIAEEIEKVLNHGVQVAIVLGGGNLFRGRELTKAGIDRVTADQMGMLATVMNSLALRDAFEKRGMTTYIMSAISMMGLVKPYNRRDVIHSLKRGRGVILSGGTGNPLVTTDSAASLRGIEVKADILLKATNVDGVYSADPSIDKGAKLYSRLTYQEVLNQELGVMDLSAFCQCRDNNLPIRVFNMHKPNALFKACIGEDEGTLITN